MKLLVFLAAIWGIVVMRAIIKIKYVSIKLGPVVRHSRKNLKSSNIPKAHYLKKL
jgi:hypothetical protein